jgi:DNA-binding NarL/FixJ family response regulator
VTLVRVTLAERSVLEAVAELGAVKRAAFALGRSPRTVEVQLASAHARLGVTTTIECVYRMFVERG